MHNHPVPLRTLVMTPRQLVAAILALETRRQGLASRGAPTHEMDLLLRVARANAVARERADVGIAPAEVGR